MWLDKRITELNLLIDNAIYFVSNLVDPIPKADKGETVESYVNRVELRHALRYVKKKLDEFRELDDNNATPNILAERFEGRDLEAFTALVKLISQRRNDFEEIYDDLLIRKENESSVSRLN